MTAYVARRLLISVVILLAATFLVYWLMSISGDPLAELRTSNDPNRDLLIAARIEQLNLDEPLLVRYWFWLVGAAGCVVPGIACDLGTNLNGQDVTALLVDAVPTTLQLVLAATVLAIVLGVAVGIVSALRQYSGFDYTITFAAFLFFSLPIFWVAVLLKEYGAIRANDWLADPFVSGPIVGGLALVAGLFFGSVLGTSRATRLLYGAIAAAAAAAILVALITTGWFENPGLGPVVIVAGAVAVSFGVTVLLVGAENRRVLAIGLMTVAVGLGAALATDSALADPTWGMLFGIGGLVIAAGVVLALVFGGIDRRAAIQVAVCSAVGVGSLVFADRTLSSFAAYSTSVGGRPVATIGNKTPNYSGTFWELTLDTLTHLVLPTLAIMLISFAAYSRFSRASMLETMNADYIRTARAKGVNERTVVLRHAFRNALIPIATLAALDFGAVFGGAIITETVFGWQGMGQLFNQALPKFDINQVMGFFVVTAVAVLVFNLLADLSYAFLDPRVRLS